MVMVVLFQVFGYEYNFQTSEACSISIASSLEFVPSDSDEGLEGEKELNKNFGVGDFLEIEEAVFEGEGLVDFLSTGVNVGEFNLLGDLFIGAVKENFWFKKFRVNLDVVIWKEIK